jgi:hypothetical protein
LPSPAARVASSPRHHRHHLPSSPTAASVPVVFALAAARESGRLPPITASVSPRYSLCWSRREDCFPGCGSLLRFVGFWYWGDSPGRSVYLGIERCGRGSSRVGIS